MDPGLTDKPVLVETFISNLVDNAHRSIDNDLKAISRKNRTPLCKPPVLIRHSIDFSLDEEFAWVLQEFVLIDMKGF